MSNQIEEQAEQLVGSIPLYHVSTCASVYFGNKCNCGTLELATGVAKDFLAKQKENWEKELVSWVENKAPITLVQNIDPLKNGQYIKAKNLLAHLSSNKPNQNKEG